MVIRGVLYYTIARNASGRVRTHERAYDPPYALNMSNNPLFPDNPLRPAAADQAAVELIRSKVSRAYGEEPNAAQEIAEAAQERTPSKHQLFMQELVRAGKGLADIQVEWHRYYTTLPDAEKQEVWEEFYAANQHTPYQKLFQKQQPVALRAQLQQPNTAPIPASRLNSPVRTSEQGVTVADHTPQTIPQTQHKAKPGKPASAKVAAKAGKLARKTATGRKLLDSPTAEATRQLKQKIQHKVSAGGKLETKHHVQSLLFGLSMGGIVLVIMLFSFFNEFIIAPFIQPSRNVGNVPVIAANITAEQAAQPSVMVPSINIQIPVDFTLQSSSEEAVQQALEGGVVHYPNTVLPGQNGNGAYFGHSSQNIFNNGKYKFAFVALHLVKTGDVFYVTYQGKVFAYEIFAREIVAPSQVSVLTDTKGEQATAVLITCDPPGLSTNRLVVWGKQISPSPSLNTVAATQANSEPVQIASNGPTLWTRLWRGVQFWR